MNHCPVTADLNRHLAEEDRAEAKDELVEELAAEYRDNDAKCREAEEWVAGTFDGQHYAEVTLALHRLHHTSADRLIGSDLMATLYRLARVEAAAMDAKLLDMARADQEAREAWRPEE